MKKILTLALTGLATVTLAACANGIPDCNNDQLDGCGRGGAYTDQRTKPAGQTKPAPVPAPVVAAPAPAPIATPVPAPEPEPAPAPAPVDTSIMKQAPEPSLTK